MSDTVVTSERWGAIVYANRIPKVDDWEFGSAAPEITINQLSQVGAQVALMAVAGIEEDLKGTEDALCSLHLPIMCGLSRPAIEVAPISEDPLDIDLAIEDDYGQNFAVLRYNLRKMVQNYAEDCAVDGSYLQKLEILQGALRDLANEMQGSLDLGKLAELKRQAAT
jgi:hypothetical protein